MIVAPVIGAAAKSGIFELHKEFKVMPLKSWKVRVILEKSALHDAPTNSKARWRSWQKTGSSPRLSHYYIDAIKRLPVPQIEVATKKWNRTTPALTCVFHHQRNLSFGFDDACVLYRYRIDEAGIWYSGTPLICSVGRPFTYGEPPIFVSIWRYLKSFKWRLRRCGLKRGLSIDLYCIAVPHFTTTTVTQRINRIKAEH